MGGCGKKFFLKCEMWAVNNFSIIYLVTGYPEAESVHSALVSAVSKAEMSDLTASVALKSLQKALAMEWNFCWWKYFLWLWICFMILKEYNEFPWCHQVVPNLDVSWWKCQIMIYQSSRLYRLIRNYVASDLLSVVSSLRVTSINAKGQARHQEGC